MDQAVLNQVFTQEYLDTLLPAETSDHFFEALYGDTKDGAYDIRLEFISANEKRIVLAYNLTQQLANMLSNDKSKKINPDKPLILHIDSFSRGIVVGEESFLTQTFWMYEIITSYSKGLFNFPIQYLFWSLLLILTLILVKETKK